MPLISLAPMAGITDATFRRISKEQGADICFSEMISAASLFFQSNKKNKSWQLASCYSTESQFFIQLFGSQPEHFALAAKKISSLKKISHPNCAVKPFLSQPSGIDINFGCPAKKVLKQNSGCALMKNPQLARKIVLAVLKNTNLPVSLKIRAGIENFSALNFLENLADLDWKILSIHGRTFEQGFSGEINWSLIRQIKKTFPQKTILANGGISSPEKAQEILEKTGADGIMIGRGALGRPWIFSQIKEYLATGKYTQPDQATKNKIILCHSQLFFSDPHANPVAFRPHLLWYFKGHPSAKKIKEKIIQIKEHSEVEKIIREI